MDVRFSHRNRTESTNNVGNSRMVKNNGLYRKTDMDNRCVKEGRRLFKVKAVVATVLKRRGYVYTYDKTHDFFKVSKQCGLWMFIGFGGAAKFGRTIEQKEIYSVSLPSSICAVANHLTCDVIYQPPAHNHFSRKKTITIHGKENQSDDFECAHSKQARKNAQHFELFNVLWMRT